MSAGRLCIREVHLADPDETVDVAAARMRDRRVGTLVVLDADRRPLGIVTDRDLVVRALADGLTGVRVRDVMTTPADAVEEDTPIEDALVRMRASAHRRLLVVDRDGRLQGILSVDDVLELLGDELARVGRLVSA